MDKKTKIIIVMIVIILFASFVIINYFNQPKYAYVPWIFIEDPRVECVENQNGNYTLYVTAGINYSWPFMVDGREKLPTIVRVKLTKYLNKIDFEKLRNEGNHLKDMTVDSRKITLDVMYYHTIWLNETFKVTPGNYTVGIQPYILVENRWWGSSWVKGCQECAEPCPIRIG
ncbi:MAG: hypothetical protein DRN05_02670 [Thermoplasmata archaeon]|nr:MAG: hypothetical protein DRN05_02670 [Thermoplasmata archaeon]